MLRPLALVLPGHWLSGCSELKPRACCSWTTWFLKLAHLALWEHPNVQTIYGI